MTAKPSDHLEDMKAACERADCIRDEVLKLRSMLCYPPMEIKPDFLQGGKPHDKENDIIKLIELEQQLRREVEAVVSEWGKATRVLQELEDKRHRNVLSKYYFQGLTLNEIARDMTYSRPQVFRIKECAKAEYNKKYKELYADSSKRDFIQR